VLKNTHLSTCVVVLHHTHLFATTLKAAAACCPLCTAAPQCPPVMKCPGNQGGSAPRILALVARLGTLLPGHRALPKTGT